ncbi:hypothetical protein K440DRAFT_578390 [Wilcoxina mikolae CBS 423.85]|nr:hypothetical protein K440DRAFT_578390 [Wilcoxina mikolae CBS 423.85]
MAQSKDDNEIPLPCLEFAINHVFLPPRLPQKADESSAEKHSVLLRLLHHSSVLFRNQLSYDAIRNSSWPAAVKMLQHFGMLENTHSLSSQTFATLVRGMMDGDALGIHITAQNAGLVLLRIGSNVVFTSFEASPTSDAVTETIGKLLISYPGPSIAVPWTKVSDPTFLPQLSNFVEKMKRDYIDAAAGRGSKAGETLQEERESTHPRFVSEMLTGILRGVGQEVELQRFMKRIADEVLWDDTKLPWRRSPLWLVVRVALRLVLGQEWYKGFMIFFMARLLDIATRRGIEGNQLFVMNAKLARRVHKQRDDRIPGFALDEARVAGERAYIQINEEWSKAQGSVKRLEWDQSRRDFMQDTYITMEGSRDYVKGLRWVNCKKPEREWFIPNEAGRINIMSSEMPDLSKLAQAGEQMDIILTDFEAWVMNSLDMWLEHNIGSLEAGNNLGDRIQDYMSAAKQAYQGNPERNSIMILTTMELWVALDRVAVTLHPLLSEYSPELNESYLSALLLPQPQQRTRLTRIERYIHTRRTSALPTNLSVFSKEITEATFAVRYFRDSYELEELETKIIEEAYEAREAKMKELDEKQQQYDRLQNTIRTLNCDFWVFWRDGRRRHDRKCKKCAMVNAAARMRIEVHEWPLPTDRLASAAVVFELQCPAEFAIWREVTFRIRTGLLTATQPPPSDQQPYDTLATYSGLKNYLDTDPLMRPRKLNYISSTKSFLSSHYRYARIPAIPSDIFINNALRFELYDSSTRIWASNLPVEMDIRHLCTFRLPDGPYKGLQYALKNTSHSANQVLARQYECPNELQLHEYIAFGLLRSGRRLQWLNMLRELRSRTLTFSAEAVNMIYLQAAWQVGSRESTEGESECIQEEGIGIHRRECHVPLEKDEFGRQMMLELNGMLTAVESNWQEVVAAQTMIVLAVQILSGTKCEEVEEQAAKFLRKARRVCLKWTRELARKLPECQPSEVREFQWRVVQMAATCRMTFDVEECYLQDVLFTDEDVAVLVECATNIHDNIPTTTDAMPTGVKAILDRDRRMAYAIEEHLRYLITSSPQGINLKPIWSEYEEGEWWAALEGPNDRWVYTHTKQSEKSESQMVHYNLISGKLLVEGLPLGRMPVEYTSHATYKELFGEKVLDVFLSSMPGMIFQTKDPISDHTVAFALDGDELIIRTEHKKDGLRKQLIPRSKLSGDFPMNILSPHFFWLQLPSIYEMFDQTNGRIDLHDIADPWTAKENWYISHSYDPSKTQLFLGNGYLLLDVKSSTTTMITNALAPLEYPEFIHVTFRKAMGLVNVHLPRLKLDFDFDKNNRLTCKQFQSWRIDNSQNIGTFTGLKNMLVLVHRERPLQSPVRHVIVPYGKMRFQQNNSHTQVEIDIRGLDRVKYHIYTVNTILGTLVGNGSLTSHLYKILLHAVTSHCLPDPLTRRTGTEEALIGLRSAATRSFHTVETEGVDTELFRLIAQLTPMRMYYPVHLKRMHRVKWRSGLSPIAQHDEFRTSVKEVSACVELLKIFDDVKGSVVWRDSAEDDLAERAAIRNAGFRTDQFGGSKAVKTKDKLYDARDVVNGSIDEARVSYVAKLVERCESRLNVHPNLLQMLEEFGEIVGPMPLEEMSKLQLGYDQKWLNPNLAEMWMTLYNVLRRSILYANMYDRMFLLTSLAYSGTTDLTIIETLLAFATEEAFKMIEPPNYPTFTLRDGYEPTHEILYDTIKTCAKNFNDSEESTLPGWDDETEQQTQERRSETFHNNIHIQATDLANALMTLWTDAEYDVTEYDITDEGEYPLIKVTEAMRTVIPLFLSWSRNCEFRDHIAEVQEVLDQINTHQVPVFRVYRYDPGKYIASTFRATIRFSDLLTRQPPALPTSPMLLARNLVIRATCTNLEAKDDKLKALVQDFEGKSPSGLRKTYTKDLQKSIDAFYDQIEPKDTVDAIGLSSTLRSLRDKYENYMHAMFRAIEAKLAPPRLGGYFMLLKAGLWPRISPVMLLQHLASNSLTDLPHAWKIALVAYGTAITMVQRMERLIRIAPVGTPNNITPETSSDFLKEFDNTRHQNWDILKYPDWLLIEIENNLLIRPVQADIALSMIAPERNQNSIMQLCMGEGKTSVIVPIVSASLADTKKLVRVVVLKPLSGQMFQTLVRTLGGLVNRRIFFMPFSRGIAMGRDEIKVVNQLYKDCIESRGILLVQPEHLLSFKLLGLEWLYNSHHKKANSKSRKGRKNDVVGSDEKCDIEVARLLLDTQKWLDTYSRDILDESDEILNVRHELIYTIGDPTPIQNHPDRWVVIQEIFDLIQGHFKGQEINVQDFEVETSAQGGRFGMIRILNLTAGKQFLREIAKKIIEDQLLTVSFRLFPADKREMVAKFISDPNMTELDARLLLGYFAENDIPSGILYLLRGLIAHNILLFSLKEKRWKVDYGLDLKRSLLAVPYRAKDSPSGKSEFSHPDVALTLTCLSYYYGGLNEEQLETCFRNLYKSENPSLKYESWIKGVALPEPYLRRLNGINLENRKQWKEIIYPTFNYNKAVIDSYLSGVVFPKEAKEFPHKLSTSGWDVASSKGNPTTGFSGTNDNRYLLPHSIRQIDTEQQKNTNARVLSYLLRNENTYMCAASPSNQRLGVEELLLLLVKAPGRQIRVLLDVGAQVLELRNDEVAKRWLDLVDDTSAQAAVYFNDNDELIVRTRDGNIEPLMVSAFADRLGSCLVYLDEAHTRGTDLKLPIKIRAAVTLGPNLTKDRLVQACMRMRRLGNGHSVLFCGPPEIDRKIMKIANDDGRQVIEVRDVLYWSMEETCANTRKILPIWAKQGIGYHQRLEAWNDIGKGKRFPNGLLEKESKTLEEHYGFERAKGESVDSYRRFGARNGNLKRILDTCEAYGVKSFSGAKMLEEQERELAHEVERERENQRPPKVGPVKHHISDEVKQFIATGKLQPPSHRQSTNIVPAFSVLERTSANERSQLAAFSERLLVTSDFCEVVERGQIKDNITDEFLRPVNWIVSSVVDRTILVIMSSFEVNRLIPEIRESSKVILHMYSPQVARTTPSYELLDFCPIPGPNRWQPNTSLVDELNIFAGQLYFPNYQTYQRLCGFLGLYLEETTSAKRDAIHSDGFVRKSDRQALAMKHKSPFERSPVTLLRALIGFRRKGQSYIATHMGHILHGRLLTEEDFEL